MKRQRANSGKAPPKILKKSNTSPRARQGGKSQQKGPSGKPPEWRKLAAQIAKASPLKDKLAAREMAADWARLGRAIEVTSQRIEDGTATAHERRALAAMASGRRRLLADLRVLEPKATNPLDPDEGDEGEDDEGAIR